MTEGVALKPADDRPTGRSLYDRARAWSDASGELDPKSAFIFLVTEVGELTEAFEWDDHDAVRGEIGDIAFATVVVHHLGHKAGFIVDDEVPSIEECAEVPGTTEVSAEEFTKLLRDIGEAILKPKKRGSFAVACAEMLALAWAVAKQEDYDFDVECFKPVVEKCEKRLASGKVVNGAFIKEEDLHASN